MFHKGSLGGFLNQRASLLISGIVAVFFLPVQSSTQSECNTQKLSSQRATELLVNRWNDLSTWSKAPLTSQCQEDVTRAVRGFHTKERWALHLFDSWAKIPPALLEGRTIFAGSYQQCRNTRAPPLGDSETAGSFQGNYCVITFLNLTNTEVSTDVLESFLLPYVQLGTCMPDSCTDEEIQDLFTARLQVLNASSVLQVLAVECRTEHRDYTTAFTLLAIFLVIVIGGLVVTGTALDLISVQWPKWAVSERETDQEHNWANRTKVQAADRSADNLVTNKKTDSDVQTTMGMAGKVLLAFSLYTNGQKLLYTPQLSESLPAISGLRVVAMAWVMLAHTHLDSIFVTSNFLAFLHGPMASRFADLLNNFTYAVDVFITTSGFLVAYGTMKKMQQKGWNIGWGRFFLHRYWRLTPPYVTVLVLVMGLYKFLGYGALWNNVQPLDLAACEKLWWANLLYVNNLVTDVIGGCFQHSWYLGIDVQFYLVSPLMLIPLYFNKKAGLATCCLFMLVSWIYTFNMSISNGWGHDMRIAGRSGANSWLYYYYSFPVSRIGPFIVGIIAGYSMAVNNGRIKLSKIPVVIGWAVTMATTLGLVFGFHGESTTQEQDSVLMSAVVNTLSRTFWGVGVCLAIILCSSGYGGIIYTLLSSSPLQILDRLGYMFYLIHEAVLYTYYANMEQPIYMTKSMLAVTFLGLFLASLLVAAVLVLTLEYPTVNLECLYFEARNRQCTQQNISAVGNHEDSEKIHKIKHN